MVVGWTWLLGSGGSDLAACNGAWRRAVRRSDSDHNPEAFKNSFKDVTAEQIAKADNGTKAWRASEADVIERAAGPERASDRASGPERATLFGPP